MSIFDRDEIPSKLTPEEALERLEKLRLDGDTEAAHGDADDILCALLRYHGHDDVIMAYDKIDKWFA